MVKARVHLAIFLTSFIGITIVIALVGMVFQSEVQSLPPDFQSSVLSSIPYAFILSIVLYRSL